MGTATPSNSLSWVSNTGYLTHPQARSCTWGNTEADGASTVRCTSKEPADPRHPITTHTPVPFTQHRPGQTNRNPEACATEATETSSKAVPAPPDAKAKHEGQIEEVGGHPSRRGWGEPTATLALRLTCCTREASARLFHGAQSAPPARASHHAQPSQAAKPARMHRLPAAGHVKAWGSVPALIVAAQAQRPRTMPGGCRGSYQAPAL